MATSSAVPLRVKPPGADVKILVVLADDHHVDVLGALAPNRSLHAGIEADGPKVDVLVKIEPQPQQNALFENSGRHLGVANRSQQNHVATM